MSRTIDQIIGHIETLPRLPDTTVRLVRVISDPTSSLDQIVETIRFDQAVTAEVLRRCNSAATGLTRKVTSIEDSIRFLGTAKVLQLVMAAHVQTMLSKEQSGYGLEPGALWSHSVAVALAGQMLAKQLRMAEGGLLFTAGLLHDVGKVVLNEYVSQEYSQIAAMVASGGVSFLEAERTVLGFTHPEVGAQLAEKWGLPSAIVRCIRYHHEPNALNPHDDLIDAIYIADSICLLTGIGGGDDGTQYIAHEDVLQRHGIDERILERFGSDVVVELKAVRALFGG